MRSYSQPVFLLASKNTGLSKPSLLLPGEGVNVQPLGGSPKEGHVLSHLFGATMLLKPLAKQQDAQADAKPPRVSPVRGINGGTVNKRIEDTSVTHAWGVSVGRAKGWPEGETAGPPLGRVTIVTKNVLLGNTDAKKVTPGAL